MKGKALNKILIAILSARDHKPQFTKSLLEMCLTIQKTKKHDFSVSFIGNCSNIARGRNIAADAAKSEGFSHLLFIDDDMAFPANLLDYLLCDKDIVAVNAAMKLEGKRTYCAIGHDMQRVDSTDKHGIESVHRAGTGIMLINTKVFDKIEKPYFMFDYINGSHIGEDYYFCEKAKQSGSEIFISHDASKLVRHIGDFAY